MENTELVAVVVGLTQLIKNLNVFPNKYMPVVATAISVTGMAFGKIFPEVSSDLLGAMIIGLTASGLYSVTKQLIGKK